jgi:hypothetical protein
MGKEDSTFTWVILLGAVIVICCSIAILGIIYLNINVSFIVQLLVVNIDIVAVFISGSVVILTIGYNKISKKNLNHEILVNLRKEYASPEMMFAIQRLWIFFRDECRKNEDELLLKYEKKSKEQEQNAMKPTKYEDKIKRVENSLSFQRRKVANFYYHLADLHILKMIPDDILFSIWGSSELIILKNIIIPIEKIQAKISGYEKSTEIKKLEKLYDHCINWETNLRNKM